MNLKPQRPATLRQAMFRAVRTAVLCTLPFAALPLLPVTHDVVPVEAGAVAQVQEQKSERQYERAMTKCEALPAGVLPGGVVIDWTDRRMGTTYTEAASLVDRTFTIAVGEAPADPTIAAFTLCR